jgi:heme/copper-type cytochrome/quinol oxidase subunit 2
MKNCKDLEKFLPLYPNDLLSDSDKQSVEEHLKSCPQCAKTLAQLQKTEKLVQNLAEVEPPAWFKQKIMVKVREEAEKKSLAQKWFYPLRIKIPVQIFATVFIAVLAVYIYRSGDQMKEVVPLSAPAPVAGVQERQLPEQKLKTAAKEPVQLKHQSIQKKEAPGEQTRKKEADPVRDANKQFAVDMKADKSASAPPPAAKSAEISAVELDKKKDSPILGSAMKSGRALKEQSVPVSRNVLLKVADINSAAGAVDKLLIKHEAKNITRQIKPGKVILTAELKKLQINDLTVQLKTIGQLEERFPPADNAAENILVVIEIY